MRSVKYGYHYRQARCKGLLTENDLKLCLKFAKDLNPIENAFNLVEKKLSSDVVKCSISKESYANLWKELKINF